MAAEKNGSSLLIYGILTVMILAFAILLTVRHKDNTPSQNPPMHEQH